MRRVDYQGKEYLIFTRSGMRLLDSMHEKGIPVVCECARGDEHAGKCEVKYPKDTQFLLSAPTELEQRVLGPKLEKGFRLACQALFM